MAGLERWFQAAAADEGSDPALARWLVAADSDVAAARHAGVAAGEA